MEKKKEWEKKPQEFFEKNKRNIFNTFDIKIGLHNIP